MFCRKRLKKTWYTSAYAETLPWNIQFILPQIVNLKNKENRATRTLWVWQMENYSFMNVTVHPENGGEMTLYLKKNRYKNLQGNIIWLEADDQYTFTRLTGTKVIQGVPFKLKEPGPSTQEQWVKGPLYQSIFDD